MEVPAHIRKELRLPEAPVSMMSMSTSGRHRQLSVATLPLGPVKSMEDGVSTVCVERAAIGERDGKLLEPVDEMIGVRNAAYVVGCEVVPYLEAPIPRHRRDLTIDETCSLRCDLLAEIFGDAGKKRASRIRYEILGRVGRRHGKAGLHGGGLAILRLGKDAKIKRRGGYATKAMTATTHDFLPSDTLSQAQVSAKLSPRQVHA